MLVFDGFDELPSSQAKNNLIKSIEKLSLNLNQTRFILTSRTGEFDLHISNSQTFEIADLNPSQINQFISNWFKDENKSERMFNQLILSPFKDTALRPLNLAHLCALFERNGEVPRKPKTVYKKIVNLLIEEWDEQRNIKRPSKFSRFTLDRKFDFLCNLSYYLTAKLAKVFFTSEMLKTCYEDISEKFDLPSKEVLLVINELESFTGLFIKSGYDRFEFSHKSLQEYLAGEYIVKSNLILFKPQFLLEMPNELAVAISLSSNPSLFLSTIIFTLRHFSASSNFAFPLFQRVLLEKPDFESTYLLPLSLIYLHDQFKEHNKNNLKEIEKLLFVCATKEVMHKSLRELKKVYWHTDSIDSNHVKAKIVGHLLAASDSSAMNVPAPYNSYLIMDKFIQTHYNSSNSHYGKLVSPNIVDS